ncbi:BPI fold-containing family B member 3-like isoform X2 [Rhinatrema bivittatum]|uniref:BPI fold-containing family B member 3-like isoform X2 n=1 Tax=Rhinatrema bivittatum TaxID=194408 RepID=UPI001128E795|nr:BPI fold-containing family B member 3-like isoform X2 [Rhinatrema bivittatum]
MGVGGRNPMGHQLHTMMGVNITTIAKMSTDQDGSPRLITENCKTTVENMDVKVQNGLQGNIPQLLNPILNKALPQLMCPLAEIMCGVVNELLSADLLLDLNGTPQNTPNGRLLNIPTVYGKKMCYV